MRIRCYSRLSAIRSIIERTFGLLKVRFRRLKYIDISDPDFGNKIIAATCVLHNFMIDNGEKEYDKRINTDDLACNVPEENAFQDRFAMQQAIAKRINIVDSL